MNKLVHAIAGYNCRAHTFKLIKITNLSLVTAMHVVGIV